MFKDGAIRAYEPDPDDPLDYEQMSSTTDDEVGALPINLTAFHEVRAEAK